MWLGQIDRLCKSVDELADLSTEYWLAEADPMGESQKHLEAKIIGKQARIDGYWVTVRARLHDEHLVLLDDLLEQISDSSSGGRFQVRGRPRDTERALVAQSNAGDLNTALRNAAWHATTFTGACKYQLQKSRRSLPVEDSRPLAERVEASSCAKS